MKKTLIALSVLFVVLFILTSSGFLRSLFKSKNISPNPLGPSQPINIFAGTVEKINGNSFTISLTVYPSSGVEYGDLPYPPKFTPPPNPTPFKLFYRVLIDQDTVIERPSTDVPYLFTTPIPIPAPKLTIKDIIIGRSVTVYSKIDLRIVDDMQFIAVKISLTDLQSNITGKIINIRGKLLTIKAVWPPDPSTELNATPLPPKEIDYQIEVNDQTEVSRMTEPTDQSESPRSEKLNFSDLKKDMRVTVYTNQDANKDFKLTALRIEPIIQSPL